MYNIKLCFHYTKLAMDTAYIKILPPLVTGRGQKTY